MGTGAGKGCERAPQARSAGAAVWGAGLTPAQAQGRAPRTQGGGCSPSGHREPVLAEPGQGGAGRRQQQALQEPAPHSAATQGFPGTSRSPGRASVLQPRFHSEAGHGALEVSVLEPLAAGGAAGGQGGSSEAGWL